MTDGSTALFGLKGITHGWGRVLSIQSPRGNAYLLAHLRETSGLKRITSPGRCVRYQEQTAGAIDTFINRYGIVLLDHNSWNEKKHELRDL